MWAWPTMKITLTGSKWQSNSQKISKICAILLFTFTTLTLIIVTSHPRKNLFLFQMCTAGLCSSPADAKAAGGGLRRITDSNQPAGPEDVWRVDGNAGAAATVWIGARRHRERRRSLDLQLLAFRSTGAQLVQRLWLVSRRPPQQPEQQQFQARRSQSAQKMLLAWLSAFLNASRGPCVRSAVPLLGFSFLVPLRGLRRIKKVRFGFIINELQGI